MFNLRSPSRRFDGRDKPYVDTRSRKNRSMQKKAEFLGSCIPPRARMSLLHVPATVEQMLYRKWHVRSTTAGNDAFTDFPEDKYPEG